ncbi:ABC transporter permease [Longispora fulva]|uniref:Peptide/nickel transport system permease protein n=1 Tax=Longispora fulva TaxID=619741 RepID=A0A8J7KJM7_9ACTN|nr:ABC transporter permease [Longispora fulva]MBG6137044.1 peptide/nickel transport system permease protein [Longispora fulva]GIG61602.1 ABC transporter permease [Longispora fulva]
MIIRFLIRRLLELTGTLVAASFLVFGAVYLAPGKPETFLLGGRSATPEAKAAIRAQYHLDDPFLVQYYKWLGQVLTGDLGRSVQYRRPVLGLIEARLPSTLLLIAMALVLVVVFGIGLGWLSALRGGATDKAVLVGTSVAVGTPSFVAAIVLIWLFSVSLGWFPSTGSGAGLADMVYHLTLPATALALYWVGVLARVTRTTMLDEMGRDHVTVARSRGIGESAVIRRHVFRNALGGIATMSGLTVSGLVVSTVLVEAAFGLGGLGNLLQSSVSVKDFPVVQAISLLIVALFVVVNLVVDLTFPLIDPRVRLGARSTL